MSDWQEERRHRDRVRRDEVMSLPVLQVCRHGVIDGQDGDVRSARRSGLRAKWSQCGRRRKAWRR